MKNNLLYILGFCIIISLINVNADCSYLANATAYWSFDSNSTDYSGNNYNGIDSDVGYLSGLYCRFFGCASFNGSTSSMGLGDNNIYDNSDNAISFSFWLYSYSPTTEYAMIFDKWGTVGYSVGMLSTTGYVSIAIYSTSLLQCRINTTTSANTWNHYVITYNGNADCSGVKFYKDGIYKATVAVQNNNPASNLNNANNNTVMNRLGSYFHEGRLDEFSIYPSVYNQVDVTNLYNSGIGCNPYYNGTLTSLTVNTNMVNGTYINYDISNTSFEFNGTIVDYENDIFNCTLFNNTEILLSFENVNLSLNNVFIWNWTESEEIFYFNMLCNESTGYLSDETETYTYIVDRIIPEVEISTDLINNSIYYMPSDKMNFSVNYSDNNLAYILLNISTENGTIIFINETYYPNISFLTLSYFNDSLLKFNYSITAIAKDDHNPINKIHEKAKQIIKDTQNLILKFRDNDTYISLYSKDLDNFEITDEDNKYRIILDSNKSKNAKIKLYSNKPLHYIENSIHQAHFISLSLDKYIDFDSNDLIIDRVERDDDYNYNIYVKFLKDTVKTNSIGDLNTNIKIYYVEVFNNVAPDYKIDQDLTNETGENFDLEFKFYAYDNNLDLMNVTYKWYANNSLIDEGDYHNIVNGTLVTITLDKTLFEVYDLVNVSINITDLNLTTSFHSNTTVIIPAVEIDKSVIPCKTFIDFSEYQFTTLDNNPQSVIIWAYQNETSIDNLSIIMEIEGDKLYFDYIDSEDYYLLEFNFLEEGEYPFVIREYIIDNQTENCGQRFEGVYRVYNYSFETCFNLYTDKNGTDEWRETGYILLRPTTDRELNYTLIDYMTGYPFTSKGNGNFEYLDFLDKIAYNYKINDPNLKILSGGEWFITEFKGGKACVDLYFSDYYKIRFVQGDLFNKFNFGNVYYKWTKKDFILNEAVEITPASNELSYYISTWDIHFVRNLTFWIIEFVLFVFALIPLIGLWSVTPELAIKFALIIFVGGTLIQLAIMGIINIFDYIGYLF